MERHRTRIVKLWPWYLAVCGLGLAAALFVAAGRQEKTSGVSESRQARGSDRASEIRGAAMRVEVQPESGDLVPAAGPAFLPGQDDTQGSGREVVIQTRPDGGQYVDLRGRFLHYSIARRNAEGKIEASCTTGPTLATSSAPAQAPATDTNGWEVK